MRHLSLTWHTLFSKCSHDGDHSRPIAWTGKHLTPVSPGRLEPDPHVKYVLFYVVKITFWELCAQLRTMVSNDCCIVHFLGEIQQLVNVEKTSKKRSFWLLQIWFYSVGYISVPKVLKAAPIIQKLINISALTFRDWYQFCTVPQYSSPQVKKTRLQSNSFARCCGTCENAAWRLKKKT